ncbi:hypothetical protein BDB00DRAFT_867663 [Zychaea mexicana]|uniref:uncharacterized protein n=1 Tax=Zychaea mexicana TaxID=64656 RepID=UPI0022FEDD83|nr:uncharacterized protein BDB00DRAFT_867663 [Zychaea mexicana]KAI9498516.1 hypothetical protein BDB00DRAFT_867663 [Zychaea mexicana]
MKSQHIAVLPNDWLEYLGSHRIFELTAAESAQAAHTFDRANQFDSFAQQYDTRVIVLRGNDLIVAVGSQLRLLDLNEVKDAWINIAPQFIDAGKTDTKWLLEIPYKTLATPTIDFRIESLIVNSTGTLLAVCGQQRLSIVCLPPSGFSPTTTYSPEGHVECKTFSVGQEIFGESRRVVKALWHPLSETKTHIMVLSSDSVLRMFDVSGNIDEPEQLYDLSPSFQNSAASRRPSRGITLDDGLGMEEEAVTFTLGGKSEEGSAWEPFTVYFALRNGHTYALCPVLPFNSVVRNQHLETLACVVDAKTTRLLEQKMDNENDLESKALYYLLRLQSQWLGDLLESVTPVDGDNVAVKSNDACIPFPIQRQGPFRVEGKSQLNSNSNEVSDILFIKAEPANIIAMAYTNGKIKNHILESEIDPQWLMPTTITDKNDWKYQLGVFLFSADILPKATVHETIDLKVKTPTSVGLVLDPLYSDTYYAYHRGGLHRLALTKLVDNLAVLEQAFASTTNRNEFTSALQEWSGKDNSAEVKCLIESSVANSDVPLLGIVIITDIYLTYSILALPRSYRLATVELGLRQSGVDTGLNTSKQYTSSESDNDTVSNGASLLAKSPFTVPSTDAAPPKIVIPPEYAGKKEIVITEDSLLFMQKTTEKLYGSIKELTKFKMKTEKRLALQQMELTRQIEDIRKLCDRLEQQHIQDEQRDKILAAAQSHGKLALRIDSVLRKVLGSYLPDMSNEEKKWFEGLQEIQKTLDGDRGYLERIGLMQSQVSTLRSRKTQFSGVALGGTGGQKKPQLSSAQLASVRKVLDEQAILVQEAKEKISSLETSLTPSAS